MQFSWGALKIPFIVTSADLELYCNLEHIASACLKLDPSYPKVY